MKKLRVLILLLLAALALSLPAAAADYGNIYDETEQLYSPELESLGLLLQDYESRYGVDVRVDVLLGMGDHASLEQAAAAIYDSYGYGSATGHGLSLTILLSSRDGDLALEDWCLYTGGQWEDLELCAQALAAELEYAMQPQAWAGAPDNGAGALLRCCKTLADRLGGLLEGLLPPDSPGQEPVSQEPPEQTHAPTEEPVENEPGDLLIAPPPTGEDEPGDLLIAPPPMELEFLHATTLGQVFDQAGILGVRAHEELDREAFALSEKYGLGVYLITLEDMADYTDGDAFDAAALLYDSLALGYGPDRDGVLLLLSLAHRDLCLYAYGPAGRYAFNDAGREALLPYLQQPLGEDLWEQAARDYLSWCDDYLAQAEAGEPYDADHAPMSDSERRSAILIRVAIILLLPLLIAGIWIWVLCRKMRSVATATQAAAYTAGSLELSQQWDIYTHTSETRTRIKSDSDSGGGSSRSSGGGSGTTGKF